MLYMHGGMPGKVIALINTVVGSPIYGLGYYLQRLKNIVTSVVGEFRGLEVLPGGFLGVAGNDSIHKGIAAKDFSYSTRTACGFLLLIKQPLPIRQGFFRFA